MVVRGSPSEAHSVLDLSQPAVLYSSQSESTASPAMPTLVGSPRSDVDCDVSDSQQREPLNLTTRKRCAEDATVDGRKSFKKHLISRYAFGKNICTC